MAFNRDVPTALSRAAAHPRAVLLWVIILLVVAICLYAAAPWILPIRINEGPLVQMASEDGVTLVWYTTRPAACRVIVTVAGEDRTQDAATDGRRNRVRINGLEPGRGYAYRIQLGNRYLTDELAFQTNRTAGRRYNFIVFGDSGRGTKAQYSLAADMTRFEPRPDFLLHTGDLIYSDGERCKFGERFFKPYRYLLPRINFWPCLGNHEIDQDGNAAAYQEVFEVPDNGPEGLGEDLNYWFDYASSRIAVIDTNVDEAILGEKVAPWLRAVMAEPGPRWKFVAFHHPPYTGGKYKPDERVRRTLVPVIEEVGLDLVFTGHDHSYQRTKPLLGGQIVAPREGVVYIITAAGGATLYEPKGALPDYVAVLDYQHYSFTHVTIDGDELTLRQIALGGDILDEFRLSKPPAGAVPRERGPQ